MVLVLLLCAILIISMVLVISITISTIKISIRNLELTNIDKDKLKYSLEISLILFKKIRWFSINLDETKIKRIMKKINLQNIAIKELEKDLSIQNLKEITKIRPQITFLKLQLNVGVGDVIITSYITSLICTIISILLTLTVEGKNLRNVSYKINPLYNNGNIYDIKLSSNIEIKIINLLNSLYKTFKSKRNTEKNKVKCNAIN